MPISAPETTHRPQRQPGRGGLPLAQAGDHRTGAAAGHETAGGYRGREPRCQPDGRPLGAGAALGRGARDARAEQARRRRLAHAGGGARRVPGAPRAGTDGGGTAGRAPDRHAGTHPCARKSPPNRPPMAATAPNRSGWRESFTLLLAQMTGNELLIPLCGRGDLALFADPRALWSAAFVGLCGERTSDGDRGAVAERRRPRGADHGRTSGPPWRRAACSTPSPIASAT